MNYNLQNNKSKNINNIFFYCTLFICTILIFIFSKDNSGSILSKKYEITIFIFILVMVALSAINFYKRDIKLENRFLLIALILGLIFIFVLPPTQGPDERVHMVRSYDVAKGRFFYKGSEDSSILPKSVGEYTHQVGHMRIVSHPQEKLTKEQYIKAKGIPLDKDKVELFTAEKTDAYMSIAYIPQGIGMFIGDALNLNFGYIFLLGRISNFLVWLILCYLALKIMPVKRELMMFIMLMPICMQQAITLSPDAMLNSCSFLLIAYILNMKYEKNNITKKDFIIIALLGIGIVAVKLPYIIISAMILTLPKEKFKSKGNIKKVSIFIGILIIGFVTFAMWGRLSTPIENNNLTTSSVQSQEIEEKNENLEEESVGYVYTFKQVLMHPVKFVSLVGKTLQMRWNFYLHSFVARFGWLDTMVPNWFVLIAIVTIIFLTFNKDEKLMLSLWDRVVYFLIAFALSALLFILMFKWDGADYNKVVIFEGLQGRYLYPFVIPFLISISKNITEFDLKKYSWIVPVISIFMLTFSLDVILLRYWI